VGFWDWLRGRPSNVRIDDDAIWLSASAKLRGLSKQIQAPPEGTPLVLVVAHFPETLAQMKNQLGNDRVEHGDADRRFSPADVARIISQKNEPRILLVLAEVLIPDEFPGTVDADANEVSILVAERHFLRSHDQAIVTFATSMTRPCRVAFHLSLDDPLLRVFAGEWVRNLLSDLGMTESNPISSPMIARRIKSAQARLAKRAIDERKAASAQEWLQLNMPQFSQPASGD
jgi:hypothetical protein